MKVKRVVEMEVPKLEVGDQIQLNVGYTATVVKIEREHAILLMDQVLSSSMSMYKFYRNARAIPNHSIFDPVRELLVPFSKDLPVRLPYVGELFHTEMLSRMNALGAVRSDFPDKKKQWSKQWECMKYWRNRFTKDEKKYVYSWLMNEWYPNYYAIVDMEGSLNNEHESSACAIRLVFRIKN